MIDYFDEDVDVLSRRPYFVVTKEEVVRRGLSGRPCQPKTSRHVANIPFLDGVPPSALRPARIQTAFNYPSPNKI